VCAVFYLNDTENSSIPEEKEIISDLLLCNVDNGELVSFFGINFLTIQSNILESRLA